MTAKVRAKGRKQVKKLKLKKETLRDLDVKGREIKGGDRPQNCGGATRVISGCSW